MPEDDYMRAMKFAHPEFIPVRVSILPAAWVKYRDNLAELTARHPVIFGAPSAQQQDYAR